MSSGPAATPLPARALLPWLWVPTLYLVEGIPNSLVENVAPMFFKEWGLDAKEITGLVATAALPWVFKPLWSPLLGLYRTKRFWIWSLQALLVAGILALALCVFSGVSPVVIAVALAAIALVSSTHDIAADGFYYTLEEKDRNYFIGFRNAAYRAGVILPQVLLPAGVGFLMAHAGWEKPAAWAFAFLAAALGMVGLAGWHWKNLPRPADDVPVSTPIREVLREYEATWMAFFEMKCLWLLALFLFFFRLAEVHVNRLATIFLLDERADGGLKLPLETLGTINGASTAAMIAGGVLGGLFAARFGLRRVIWPFVFFMHLPNLAFLALAHWQPESLWWIGAGVMVEKLGYGIGYTVFALVMVRICDGPHRVAHFSFATGLAYLGNLLPGYWIGHLTDAVGYENFFAIAMLCTLPGFAVTWLATKHVVKDG